MKATERRQAILELLCERKTEKLENMAYEFSVSVTTIWRDVQELSLSYPIYTVGGTWGGVYIDKDYVAGRQYLSEKQENLLLRLMENVEYEDKCELQKILNKFCKTVENKKYIKRRDSNG